MTLSELCTMAGVPSKWVLNGRALWGDPPGYSAALARRLAVTHALHTTLGMPLALAHQVAADALAAPPSAEGAGDAVLLVPVREDAPVCVAIDLARILTAVEARWAAWRAGYGARVGGRPRTAGRPAAAAALARAADWGLDLSVLEANLRRSPAERLRQLDGMMAFRRRVRRVPDAAA